MNNKFEIVLKPAKTFCRVQSGGVRDDAVAGLLEEGEISYGDHSRKEYYRRIRFQRIFRARV